MLKNLLNIKYDIEGRNIETNETNETKSISDYFTNPELKASEQKKEKAKQEEVKSEVSLKDVVSKMGKLIHSDEMEDLKNTLGELTKKEYQQLSNWTQEHIVPELNNFKETLKEKGVLDKIEAFKQEAQKIIKELLEKAKELKENNENPQEARKLKMQAALLNIAVKQEKTT